MARTSVCTLLAVALLVFAEGQPGFGESDELKALRREVEALKAGQTAIRNELQEIKRLLGERQTPSPRKVEGVVLRVGESPAKGEASAKVTVVEFSDYQCPFCARHHRETLPQIERDYIATGKVKYVFRNFPVAALHKQAFQAAEAASCAGDRGRFWGMHDRLFADQAAVGAGDLLLHAQALALDVQEFQRCLDSRKHAPVIRRDLAEGQKAGVRGTPTFFLGLTGPGEPEMKVATMIVGAQPYASFREAIEALLAAPR